MFRFALFIPAAAAETDAATSAAGATAGLVQATLGLALVLALIWGAAWVVRRIAPSIRTVSSTVKVISAQNVGPRERVVVVEIGNTWLVLGVAPGSVRALHTLPKSTVSDEGAAPQPFGRLFARAKGDPGA